MPSTTRSPTGASEGALVEAPPVKAGKGRRGGGEGVGKWRVRGGEELGDGG